MAKSCCSLKEIVFKGYKMKKLKQFVKERMNISKKLHDCQNTILDLQRKCYKCIDCDDYAGNYMVKNEVWFKAVPDYVKFKRGAPQDANIVAVCLPCLERRLNRKLTIDDFSDAPINKTILHIIKI